MPAVSIWDYCDEKLWLGTVSVTGSDDLLNVIDSIRKVVVCKGDKISSLLAKLNINAVQLFLITE